MYDTLWSEVKQLQAGGIKVMMMLGGAARGTFERLSGDDASVSIDRQPSSIKFKHN
jgi:cyclin-dependent kinase